MSAENNLVQQLRWAVQARAAQPYEQSQLFPPFICLSCELLDDFSNWYDVVRTNDILIMTAVQEDALLALHAQVESMNDIQCFVPEELSRSPDWPHLRELAATCLRAFGWPMQLPPKNRSVYVQGG